MEYRTINRTWEGTLFAGLEISGCTGARCTQKFGGAPKFLKLGARRAPGNFREKTYFETHFRSDFSRSRSH